MTTNTQLTAAPDGNKTVSRVGFYVALLMALFTAITFGFAMIAIPVSGANCGDTCVEYPYLNTLAQFPRDFLWMPLAMVVVCLYLALMAVLHAYAEAGKKVYSQIGLSFAMMAAVVLLVAYYTQFSIIPVSLMNGETEGLPLLIQYNPHGIFIALEELGYLLMSLSFGFMAPVFAGKGRLKTAVAWVFGIGFVQAIVALTAFSIGFGLNRLDRFEVVVLSFDWLALIVNGVLLSIVFKRQ